MFAILIACGGGESAPPPTPGATGSTLTPDTSCVPATDGIEIPNDDVDQNCNGWADELGFGTSVDAAATAVLLQGAYDGIGSDLATGVDAEGVAWLAIGARGGLGAERLPGDGALDLWMDGQAHHYESWTVAMAEGALIGLDEGDLSAWIGTGTPAPDDAVATLDNGATSMAAGDVDGDGRDELATVGYGGVIEVFGEFSDGTWASPRLTVTSAGFGASFRSRLVLGDVTGDGVPEIVASEHNTQTVWVLPADAVGAFVPEDLGWAVSPATPDAQSHLVVAVGDVTGDGWPDLLCGGDDGPNTWRGHAYLLAGPIDADLAAADAVATFASTSDNDRFPAALAVLPDQDGDGADEVVASSADGWLQIVAGGMSGAVLPQDASLVLVSNARGDQFGSVLLPVDYDQDGAVDLAVGAPSAILGGQSPLDSGAETVLQSGAVYLFSSPLIP